MTTKPPEEGQIWEWRAFGRISDTLAAKVRSYPVRFSELPGDDIYLISPDSDQNVKLRRYPRGCVLKLKLLFESKTRPFELYNESAEFTYPFPVSVDSLKDAARLLAVTPRALDLSVATLDEVDFVKAMAKSRPPVTNTRVSKKRWQYQF